MLLWDPSGGELHTKALSEGDSSATVPANAEYTLDRHHRQRPEVLRLRRQPAGQQEGPAQVLRRIPKGNVTTVTSFTSSGSPEEVQRSVTICSVTTIESYLYTYLTSGGNSGKLSNVKLRRQVGGGSWTTIRQVDYTYYDGSESHGNLGDLKKAVIKDGSGTTIDTSYMRYYTSGESNGYVGGLKYLFSASVLRSSGGGLRRPDHCHATPRSRPTPTSTSNTTVTRQVTKQTVQGIGCTVCTGGLGTYDYAYATSAFPDGYNSWRRKTTVDSARRQPSGSVYTNYAGQVMLDITKDTTTSNEWITYYKYDSAGRLILQANPSAVSGYDDTYADLAAQSVGQLRVPP